MVNNHFYCMIVNIINYIKLGFNHVFVKFSKNNINILKILKREGYLKKIILMKFGINYIILISFLCIDNIPIIQKIKIVSKSSIKIYKKYFEVPKFMNGLGLVILSTTKGFLTDYDSRRLGVGGKVICYVF